MNKKLVAIAVIGLLVVSTGSYFVLTRQAGASNEITLHGNVDIREVELAFRQPGRLAKLYFDEGAAVKQGQLLAELDAKPYEDALAVAKANRALAEADLNKVRHGSREQEIAQADAAVHQATAALAEAERNFTRQKTLADSDAASERTFDAARSARDQAQAALSSAEQGLGLRREGSRKEDIAAAEARFAAAQAQWTQAETALADTQLIAPADALVSVRVREVGSMVSNAAPIYTLSLQDPVYVRAYVSGPQLTKIKPGGAVTVTADGTSERFKGTIGFISPKAEFTPKSVETTELRTDLVYRVRVVLPGAAHALRQGMPVSVTVDEAGH
ncbi:secretion protein HlyD [Rhodoferax sp.]|uniref:secretion protein HlyD n=1 Tax=Rhodoferax sp. TaxID=50421 RepID=UPI0028435FBA|nr:secretion protein HlyD [Rhodoferax sp.]MDR3371410.1 secretion protein HlyD [Rhodoferax sp.]